MNHNQTIGRLGEEAARALYISNGFDLLVTNFFNHKGKSFGEIDFAVCRNGHIHFVEVKTRTSERFGIPEEAVSKTKQMRIRRAVAFFIQIFSEFRQYHLHVDIVSVRISPVDNSVQKIKITSDAIESQS